MVIIISLFLVKVDVKSRVVTVSGKRGKLVKAFKHLKVEITKVTETNPETQAKTDFLEINSYLTTYKQSAILYTVGSHIKNMIKGVTKGFRYKMHIVKKHFPIEIKITKEHLEIGRFLGEKDLKIVKLLEGVSVSKNDKNAEELYFDGIDLDKVSLTCKIYKY
jgi:large subunit ribosomal protein L9e